MSPSQRSCDDSQLGLGKSPMVLGILFQPSSRKQFASRQNGPWKIK